ncbi:unnamed protein product [Alternaria burnsii]|nr:unnamed protein product [Alternaria burnsii]
MLRSDLYTTRTSEETASQGSDQHPHAYAGFVGSVAETNVLHLNHYHQIIQYIALELIPQQPESMPELLCL